MTNRDDRRGIGSGFPKLASDTTNLGFAAKETCDGEPPLPIGELEVSGLSASRGVVFLSLFVLLDRFLFVDMRMVTIFEELVQ